MLRHSARLQPGTSCRPVCLSDWLDWYFFAKPEEKNSINKYLNKYINNNRVFYLWSGCSWRFQSLWNLCSSPCTEAAVSSVLQALLSNCISPRSFYEIPRPKTRQEHVDWGLMRPCRLCSSADRHSLRKMSCVDLFVSTRILRWDQSQTRALRECRPPPPLSNPPWFTLKYFHFHLTYLFFETLCIHESISGSGSLPKRNQLLPWPRPILDKKMYANPTKQTKDKPNDSHNTLASGNDRVHLNVWSNSWSW